MNEVSNVRCSVSGMSIIDCVEYCEEIFDVVFDTVPPANRALSRSIDHRLLWPAVVAPSSGTRQEQPPAEVQVN